MVVWLYGLLFAAPFLALSWGLRTWRNAMLHDEAQKFMRNVAHFGTAGDEVFVGNGATNPAPSRNVRVIDQPASAATSRKRAFLFLVAALAVGLGINAAIKTATKTPPVTTIAATTDESRPEQTTRDCDATPNASRREAGTAAGAETSANQ